MTSARPDIRTIALENLFLSQDNPRFESKASQRDAIATMIRDQGEKLLNLAGDILDNGLDPSNLPIVRSSDDQGGYIVMEGNRRILALKILQNPTLIDTLDLSGSQLKKYHALQARAEAGALNEVDCVVIPEEDALHWIQLRHTGENEGIGLIPWDGVAAHRFRGSSPALQAVDLVAKKGILDDETRQKLPKIFITNIERILGTPEAREALGVEVKNRRLSLRRPEDKALSNLAHIVFDIANRIVKVTDLDSKPQRVTYANKIVQRPPFKPSSARSGTPPSLLKKVRKVMPIHRPTLIPKNLRLSIPSTRINGIYDELRKLSVDHFKNSVAIGFRVFVEMSVDEYGSKRGISFAVLQKKKGKSPPQKREMTLREKIAVVAKHLEGRGKPSGKELHGIRVAISTKNHLLSVDNWHSYVHNKAYTPTPSELKTNWDNVQPFIENIWS